MPGRVTEPGTVAPDSPSRRAARGLRTLSLPEQIAEHLGHLIIAGEYQPGDHLKEQEIAESFAVSRGPVRDALHMLEKRGFIEILPRRGAHVVDLGLGEVVDIFNIRASLFGLAARLAATTADAVVIAAIEQAARRMKPLAAEADTTPFDYGTATRAAQRLVAEASGNRRLVVMLEELDNRGLWRMIWRDRPLDHDTVTGRQQSATIWGRLAAALKKREGAAAEARARDLILASRDRVMQRIGRAGR